MVVKRTGRLYRLLLAQIPVVELVHARDHVLQVAAEKTMSAALIEDAIRCLAGCGEQIAGFDRPIDRHDGIRGAMKNQER